jgi:hypothetical protein
MVATTGRRPHLVAEVRPLIAKDPDHAALTREFIKEDRGSGTV